jgi:arylsulfatase A-like enzyme
MFRWGPIDWLYKSRGLPAFNTVYDTVPSLREVLRTLGSAEVFRIMTAQLGDFAGSLFRAPTISGQAFARPAFVFGAGLIALLAHWREQSWLAGLSLLALTATVGLVCLIWHIEFRFFTPLVPLAAISFAGLLALAARRLGPARRGDRVAVLVGLVIAGAALSWPPPLALGKLARAGHDSGDWVCRDAGDWIRENAAPDDVVLTLNPWWVAWQTQRPAVAVPGGGVKVLERIARRYDARWLLVSPDRFRPGDARKLERLARRPDGPLAPELRFEGETCSVLSIDPARPTATAQPSDVVLVSIDTLRPDHLGLYGYAKPTGPPLDAFAREAAVFRSTIAHSSSTLASHGSLFTSMLPVRHGAYFSLGRPLPEERATLAELLREAGWRTVEFHGSAKLARELGLGQGFDVYERVVPRFRDTAQRACAWLDEEARAPYFLFLHTYEVHHPYRPDARDLALFETDYTGTLPNHIEVVEHLQRINARDAAKRLPITEADLAHIVHAYDAEIRSMDAAFGELIDCLRAAGRLDHTLIIFTSDHGEEFGEHGKVGWHSHTLYDELLRVPLIIRFPGGRFAGASLDEQVRILDIAPTMLDVYELGVGRFRSGDVKLAGGSGYTPRP